MLTKTLASLLFAIGVLATLCLAASNPQTSVNVKPGAPVSVGSVAPDFTLTNQDGRRLTLASERGKRPVVLVFYRGYW
jgi:cytochrome oxidase Cu insertion factor (SCO1/SenC/PrrC family)